MSASVHVDLFSRHPVTMPLATCASFFQAQITPGSPHNLALSNLTIRQHTRRMGRKVNAFSKDHIYLEHHLALSFAYYHFVVPHRGLRQPLAHPLPTKGSGSLKRWVQRTPAMAAGLTDHIWTMDELLSFRVPSRRVWPSTSDRQHGKYQTKSFLTQCRYAISSTLNCFSWRSLHDLMR
jgi:hypothetical protein